MVGKDWQEAMTPKDTGILMFYLTFSVSDSFKQHFFFEGLLCARHYSVHLGQSSQ